MTTRIDDPDFAGLISDARSEQREAIRSESRLTVVSAGAGTGKTDTLARRFAWLLLTDPTCRVDQILTLTFTQFAAGEMRERIRATLRSWRTRIPEKTQHLADAIERLDEAYISTIHSFALRVIRETGLDLDIDPNVALVGEPVEREFWNEFEWNLKTGNRERLLAPLSGAGLENARALLDDPLFNRFLNHFGASLLANLGKSAGEVFGSMNLPPGYLADFDPSLEDTVAARIARDMEPVCRDVWDAWQIGVFPSVAKQLSRSKSGVFADNIRSFNDAWFGAERTDRSERAFFVELMNGPLSRLPGSGELKKTISESLGVALKDWRDSLREAAALTASVASTPRYGEGERVVRAMLGRAAAMAWESWDAARASAGLLSFADLVRFAGNILAGNSLYANRFRHVMIDEFQDTDGIQNDMVSALAGAWSVDEPRTVFIVGDIKQSIYRFRHANPALFAGYMKDAARAPDSTHIPMAYSYRMRADLMRCVNLVFKSVWERGVIEGGEANVPYEPLMPPEDAPWWGERSSAEGTYPPMEILLQIPNADDEAGMKTAERRKMLASGIAEKISQMVASGDPVWDKAEKRYRATSWSDVTVLVPTRTSYSALDDAFTEKGVPVVFGRSMQYYGRGEVQDMINLLRLLDMPEDDFSFISWVESPFSGIPPEASAALLESPADAGGSFAERMAEAYPKECGRLVELRRKSRLASPSCAVMALLEDDSWLSSYSPDSRPRILANIRRGVDLLREYESSFGRGLHAAADYLGRAMRSGGAAEEPDIADDDVDAVRVMTVHASKGLEFPVVVIMGMESSARAKMRDKAFVSQSLGVVAGKIPDINGDARPGGPVDSVTARWHSYIESGEERAESQRLMYVAMTRARDRLLCAGLAKDESGTGRGDNWLDWLLEANAKNGGIFPISLVPNEEPSRTFPKNLRSAGENTEESVDSDTQKEFASSLGELLAPRLSRISATAYSMFSWCPVAYRLRYRQGVNLAWDMPDGDGYGGADLGSLAHWVMMRWDMRADSLGEHLPAGSDTSSVRTIPPYLRAVYSKERERAALREWLEAFARTDTCEELRELKGFGRLRQETAFHVALDGSALVGSIDVCWEDKDGAHIRDWKITDERRAPDELYDGQLDFYALAYSMAHPGTPLDVGLIYLRRPDSRNFRAEVRIFTDADSVAAKVKKVMQTAVSGPFNPSSFRCVLCPFSRLCPESAKR